MDVCGFSEFKFHHFSSTAQFPFPQTTVSILYCVTTVAKRDGFSGCDRWTQEKEVALEEDAIRRCDVITCCLEHSGKQQHL